MAPSLALLLCALVAGAAAVPLFPARAASPDDAYARARAALLASEAAMSFTANCTLAGEREAVAAAYLQWLKLVERDRAERFPPAHAFLAERPLLAGSRLLALMERFPKGGNLHVHDQATADLRQLLADVMGAAELRADLCVDLASEDLDRFGRLAFYPPGSTPAGWTRVDETDLTADDLFLLIALADDRFDDDVPSAVVWSEYARCFYRMQGLVDYDPVFRLYVANMLEQALADNTQYLEVRGRLGSRYRLHNGSQVVVDASGAADLALVQEMVADFVAEHPGRFLAVTYVWLALRTEANSEIVAVARQALALRRSMPEMVVAFDMAGEEDNGRSHLAVAPDLQAFLDEEERFEGELPLVFHAGESSWPGDLPPGPDTDLEAPIGNLADALLLGARRLGHALALAKRPGLYDYVREHNVAIEACLVSNQVLGYVRDLRAHPVVDFLAAGLPVVLGSDAHGIFGTRGLSHDYYEAAAATGVGLCGLKTLARNSLQYSMLDAARKADALALWEARYDAFLDEAVAEACADDELAALPVTFNALLPATVTRSSGALEATVYGHNLLAGACRAGGLVCGVAAGAAGTYAVYPGTLQSNTQIRCTGVQPIGDGGAVGVSWDGGETWIETGLELRVL